MRTLALLIAAGLAAWCTGCAFIPEEGDKHIFARCEALDQGACYRSSDAYNEAERQLRAEEEEAEKAKKRLAEQKAQERWAREAMLPPPALYVEMGGDPSPAGNEIWRSLPIWLICRAATEYTFIGEEDIKNSPLKTAELYVAVWAFLHSDPTARALNPTARPFTLTIGRAPAVAGVYSNLKYPGEFSVDATPTRLPNGCYHFEATRGLTGKGGEPRIFDSDSTRFPSGLVRFDFCPSNPEASGGDFSSTRVATNYSWVSNSAAGYTHCRRADPEGVAQHCASQSFTGHAWDNDRQVCYATQF